MKKIIVGILFGGKSKEHEVSIWSARSIVESIDREKYDVVPLAVTKQNRLVTQGGEVTRDAIIKGGEAVLRQQCVLPQDEHDSIGLGSLSFGMVDIILPFMHGDYGEDGRLQGFLEMLDIPYVGSGVLGSSVGMDKVVQKQLCTGMDIPMVPWMFFFENEWDQNPDVIKERIEAECGFPCFVKPSNTGSSIGVSKVKNAEELDMCITEALIYDNKIIVEKGLERPREIEVSVMGNQDVQVCEIMAEIRPTSEFYDFDAKYAADSTSKAIIPAEISAEQKNIIIELSSRVYQLMTAAGLSRIDFFLDHDGTIYWNEINTLPGFTSNSAYAKMWAASGMSYAVLLDKLIGYALERANQQKTLHYEA